VTILFLIFILSQICDNFVFKIFFVTDFRPGKFRFKRLVDNGYSRGKTILWGNRNNQKVLLFYIPYFRTTPKLKKDLKTEKSGHFAVPDFSIFRSYNLV